MKKKPIDEIREKLAESISEDKIFYIPEKWEKIGDILILKIDEKLADYKKHLGRVYADVLNSRSVLEDTGGIQGEFRKPKVKHIYGDLDTETIHKENNVFFKLDPKKIMFSSGNMSERIRISKIVDEDEIVMDLFAGIGYFSIPIAVHSKPTKIFACEKNREAYSYLCYNIKKNNVSDIITPVLGDNREIDIKNKADRIIMGYIGKTIRFLPSALEKIKEKGGIIHFHDTFADDQVPKNTFDKFKEKTKKYGYKSDLIRHIKVKNYAPGISHYVFDIRLKKI
ncbi:MAG: class I SAM-dependent methyltransferase family protein [Candidatus Thermoplasmatota archaeon]